VTSEPLSFFTVDRGTATTAAALIAPYGERFRLLASGAAPAAIPADVLLEDLVRRVTATDPGAVPDPGAWREWARLETVTREPPVAVCAAGTERRLGEIERVLGDAGWEVSARLSAGHPDALVATEACLDRRATLLVVAAGEPATGDDRAGLAGLLPVLGAALARRPDLALVTVGAVPTGGPLPTDRVIALPAAAPRAHGERETLRDRLAELAAQAGVSEPGAPVSPDGRSGLRRSAVSLAALLDRRIDAVEVGHAAGSRTLAAPGGDLLWHVVRADAALVPRPALTDDRLVDSILRWSAVRGDAFALRDRVRNLRLAPWRDAAGDGAQLRLAALRAALMRLEAASRPETPRQLRSAVFSWDGRRAARQGGPRTAGELLIAAGGALSVVPPSAAALALVDGLRRPGAVTMFHDHARLLAPIGTLPDESDRRRLLADLLDDTLLPLGSAIVAPGLRPGRHVGRMRLASAIDSSDHELVPGTVRSFDLPPGLTATAEIETREGVWLGVRTRHVAMEVAGGLAGLLVDTRDVPLRVPERAERRRALIESWERPMWTGAGA
jgi:hypothetical protein